MLFTGGGVGCPTTTYQLHGLVNRISFLVDKPRLDVSLETPPPVEGEKNTTYLKDT
jgi:hypothetical protein